MLSCGSQTRRASPWVVLPSRWRCCSGPLASTTQVRLGDLSVYLALTQGAHSLHSGVRQWLPKSGTTSVLQQSTGAEDVIHHALHVKLACCLGMTVVMPPSDT